MTQKDAHDMVRPILADGEKLLWSHVSSTKAKPRPSKIASLTGRGIKGVLILFYLMILLFMIETTPALDIGEAVKYYAPWVTGGIILTWFVQKLNISRQIDRLSQRKVFFSGVITDARILLFNDDILRHTQIEAKNLTQASVDFHEGGQALCLSTSNNTEDHVLIGIADFVEAAKIANQII